MAVRVTQEAFNLLQTMNTQLGSVLTTVDTMLADGTTLDEDADWAGGNNRHHTAEWNEKVHPKFEPLPEELGALHGMVQNVLDDIERRANGF